MIDLAKKLNSDAQMISLAQIFCQQPRNTVSVILPRSPTVSSLNAFISQLLKVFPTANKHPETRSYRGCSNANLPVLILRLSLVVSQSGALAQFPSDIPLPSALPVPAPLIRMVRFQMVNNSSILPRTRDKLVAMSACLPCQAVSQVCQSISAHPPLAHLALAHRLSAHLLSPCQSRCLPRVFPAASPEISSSRTERTLRS